MKRILPVLVLSVLVLSPSAAKSQCDATTVGEAKYSWIKIKSGIDVFSETKTALGNLGWGKGHDYDCTLDLMGIASNIYGQDYGGVLLWESHGGLVGGEYCALIEEFDNKPAADSRKSNLTCATYTEEQLVVVPYLGKYYVSLTQRGVKDAFAGCGWNAIALIASCNSNVSGDWGAKARIGYCDGIGSGVVQAEMNTLSSRMTANNGKYDCMKISQAMGLFQELLGDGNKVLIPWAPHLILALSVEDKGNVVSI